MSQAPVSTSGLVRVTVASGTRRVDLVLPGAVPVAELVPELARSVGLLDSATVYGGYRLVTTEGRRLAGDSGLTLQGVEDGTVITVTAGADLADHPVYDDIVEAMTDVVEHDLRPWEPASGRRTALGAAAVLMALGAVALLLQHEASLARTAAAVVAAALVAGAIVLSRAQGEPEAAVTVAWMGVGYAAVAGPDVRLRRRALRLPARLRRRRARCAVGLLCLDRARRRPHPAGAGRRRRARSPAWPGSSCTAADADAAVLLSLRADLRRARRQRLPVARPRRHQHHRRPALRARPTSPPTPTRSTRPGSRPTRGWRTRSWSPSPRPSAPVRAGRARSPCRLGLSGTLLAVVCSSSSCSAPVSTAPAPRSWSASSPASSASPRSPVASLRAVARSGARPQPSCSPRPAPCCSP